MSFLCPSRENSTVGLRWFGIHGPALHQSALPLTAGCGGCHLFRSAYTHVDAFPMAIRLEVSFLGDRRMYFWVVLTPRWMMLRDGWGDVQAACERYSEWIPRGQTVGNGIRCMRTYSWMQASIRCGSDCPLVFSKDPGGTYGSRRDDWRGYEVWAQWWIGTADQGRINSTQEIAFNLSATTCTHAPTVSPATCAPTTVPAPPPEVAVTTCDNCWPDRCWLVAESCSAAPTPAPTRPPPTLPPTFKVRFRSTRV